MSNDNNRYRIPTVLFYKELTKEWLIGEDAIQHSLDSNLIKDIIIKAENNENERVCSNVYSPISLLEISLTNILPYFRFTYKKEMLKVIPLLIKPKHTPF